MNVIVKNLCFSYKIESRLLYDLSFSLNQGDILSIAGKNGSGKSTLLKCVMGYIKDFTGCVLFDGSDIKTIKPKELSKIVAYVPQLSEVYFDFTVEDFVLMGRNSHLRYLEMPKKEDVEIVAKTAENLGISHLLKSKINEISGGEQQLAYIARALVQEPKILVFDEPTSALDYSNSVKIIELIKRLSKEGYIIIITCHNPDYSFELNSVSLMLFGNGKYIFGKTSDIMTAENLSELYGVRIQVVNLEEHNKKVCIVNE